MVNLRRLRIAVIVVCVAAIPTMIVVVDSRPQRLALFGGMCAAVAIACLLVATTVVPFDKPVSAEEEAARVEALIAQLVTQGADEANAARPGPGRDTPRTHPKPRRRRRPERGGRSTGPDAMIEGPLHLSMCQVRDA